MNTGQVILLLVPILLLELALLGLAIRDLLKDERHVRGGNKALWALVIVFISLLGPIVYFAIGREDV
jgi:hypothetical protein